MLVCFRKLPFVLISLFVFLCVFSLCLFVVVGFCYCKIVEVVFLFKFVCFFLRYFVVGLLVFVNRYLFVILPTCVNSGSCLYCLYACDFACCCFLILLLRVIA